MDKHIVKTDNAPDPVGPYSQAVYAGQFVFCSGQIAINPSTGEIVNNDIESETAQVMDNLKAVLEAAGSSFGSVVKTTIFTRNMGDFVRINNIYGNYFGENPPARATIEVSALPKDVNVEIECIALREDNK
ncbi:RidA family protein [Candidatus Latescibacterota bacterium]